MENQFALSLSPSLLESRTDVFNARCTLRSEGEQRVVVVSGIAACHYSAGDVVAEAYAMVFLVRSMYATQAEVARVYGCSERSVRRHQRRYEEGGMSALVTRSGWRPGRRRLPVKRRQQIERLKAAGLSNRDIARRLGVTENAIRRQVGPTKGDARQLALPVTETAPSAVAEAVAPSERDEAREPTSLDLDPLNRVLDRGMACLGLLDDAAPMFADVVGVPGAGVLCALPALVHSGALRIADKLYGGIGPAFYGLRTTLLVLLFMALWRIKRPESLKERDPASLGLVLGLDRAPEVKTVRRKLTRLAARHKAEDLGRELARLRVEQRGALMGFLYVDGHVRAYHGKRDIPKAHVARMRLAMPATTDYWVGDCGGDPLFVLTAEANAGMVEMLPELLREIRGLVGNRRVTVVFDRGGWSPKLFKQIVDAGFDILTYRKGKAPLIDEKLFSTHCAVLDDKRVEYRLNDQKVAFLDGKLRLRQVTRLSADGHQTQIVTSRVDLSAVEVAFRMFGRWRQENFFKYEREEFALDALADHQVEPDDPTRTVPNPKRREIAKQIKAARSEIKALEQSLGAALVATYRGNRPVLAALAEAHVQIDTKIKTARKNLERRRAEQKQTPLRVEIRDISEGAVIKLATERKHLTNLVKMLAFQAESDLLALLDPHYRRADDEGRTLLHELFAARADITPSASELLVTLHPLSSPHRTMAVAYVCRALNDSATHFPGTNLRLRFAVHTPPRIGLAFPGPRPAPATADADLPDKSHSP